MTAIILGFIIFCAIKQAIQAFISVVRVSLPDAPQLQQAGECKENSRNLKAEEIA
jgi:hypothetical protein